MLKIFIILALCCAGVLCNVTETSGSFTSKRVDKCKAYSEYVYNIVKIPPFRSGGKTIIQKNSLCGRNSSPFLIGGDKARAREFPHSALLGYQNGSAIVWGCGGSLVSSRYILTAAHCLNHIDFGPIVKIRLGDLNITSTSDDATPMDFDIEQRIPHPNYKSSSKYNDIALIKVSKPVPLSPYIRPICLPTEDNTPEWYLATGWGFTNEAGHPSDPLLRVKLQSFTPQECSQMYMPFIGRNLRNGIESTQLCAGHRTEEKDTCNGDSGGPLEIYHPNVTCSSIQLGITSFSVSCGLVNFPAIYTRVFSYADWIETIVWANEEDF